MKKGFTLVEIMIVVAILGILAALVLPELQGHTQKAREATAKDNIRMFRNAVEVYAAQHDDVPPGYPGGDASQDPLFIFFSKQMKECLSELPENPFNNKIDIFIVGNGDAFPAGAINGFGWIYQPSTKTVKLSWNGTDSEGVSYFDY